MTLAGLALPLTSWPEGPSKAGQSVQGAQTPPDPLYEGRGGGFVDLSTIQALSLIWASLLCAGNSLSASVFTPPRRMPWVLRVHQWPPGVRDAAAVLGLTMKENSPESLLFPQLFCFL